MTHRTVWFRREVLNVLREFCRRNGVSFNRVVNLAVEQFLGRCDDSELRFVVEKDVLKREERGLKDDWRIIARSGSYLPQYVDKVVRPVDSPFRQGQVPLRALNRDEEEVFLRIASRREEIARRLVEIDRLLLPEKKFRLKPSRSRRARHSNCQVAR